MSKNMVPLNCERPQDINLIRSRLREAIQTGLPVILSNEEAATLMRYDDQMTRRLCSD